MTDVPWTPGPWFAQPGFLTIYIMSEGTSGLTCAVASVLFEQPGLDQANANARLLAEAPAMAEALELLAGFAEAAATLDWNEDRNVMWAAVMVDKTRAILARIKGATP